MRRRTGAAAVQPLCDVVVLAPKAPGCAAPCSAAAARVVMLATLAVTASQFMPGSAT